MADTAAELRPFAPGLPDHRRLQRRDDRQRRAGNPDIYRADGTVPPGRSWRVSRRQAASEGRVADLLRRHADQRRNENGRLANRIVRQGWHVRTEDVRVGAWTRMFGRQDRQERPGGGGGSGSPQGSC